ncbi:MAG: ribosome-associated translation inhibitor RaiA [Ignavibacteriales bacterium]|nr:ribosome-associated translation inhibitor RaiA [Ignavibacteriales bacterium]
MNTTVTSRHFKAHDTLVEYAESAVEKFERYYDGILKCEVKLSFEKARNSVKVAEIILSVYKTKITSVQTSDDFNKSIDGAVEKVLAQLKKYKEKLHAKDRTQVRRVRAKS